jgi:NADH:ubiquinone oxidoreductase subunit E
MKHKITICTGTACYILGGADSILLDEYLPPKMKGSVEITGSPCLGFCRNDSGMKPPFALVDGSIMSEANVQKIIDFLERS